MYNNVYVMVNLIQQLVPMIVLIEISQVVCLLQCGQHCRPYSREILAVMTPIGWNS